ncbi:MerR family transcriptional regulator [Siminovitchia terrae]|uniref:MerR family transcriptional regulator n=1 Tax=Siminovitchia terrae TaxID=1914933 RepID=UPI001BB31453
MATVLDVLLPLKKIKEVIDNPSFDRQEALGLHRKMLLEKRRRIDQMVTTINRTLQHMKGEIQMTYEEKFEVFKEKLINDNEQEYGEETREKYGDDTVNASNAKLKGMSKEDYQSMINLEKEILSLLEKAYATRDPASDLAHEVAAKHKAWLMYSWPSYSKEAHAGLAEMYVVDERFTTYYDKSVEGGTKFLRDAILIYLGKK